MSRPPFIVCIGGACVDRTYQAFAPLAPGTSNPVRTAAAGFGGVARNVAETLARLDVPAGLVSSVGADEPGRALSAHLGTLGVTTHLIVSERRRTAEYVAVLDPSGGLAFGLADMEIFEALTPSLIDELWPLLSGADGVFADCNLPRDTLAHLIARCREPSAFKLAVDAVSTSKARRLPSDLAGVDLLFANLDEACAIAGADLVTPSPEDLVQSILHRGAGAVVMTLGARGVLAAERGGAITILPAVAAEVVDVTGAGDALIAGTLSRVIDGAPLVEALRIGLVAAALAIETGGSVRPDLSPGLIRIAAQRLQALSDPEEAQ
jgi:pseudouridine kinase